MEEASDLRKSLDSVQPAAPSRNLEVARDAYADRDAAASQAAHEAVLVPEVIGAPEKHG
jgi:hypothetical protein